MGRYHTDVILTSRIQKTILNIVTKMVNDKSVRSFYPKLMCEDQNILCFHDLEPITIGQRYISVRGHGHIRKFFHVDCYKRMWY